MKSSKIKNKASEMGFPSFDRTTTAVFGSLFTVATLAQFGQLQPMIDWLMNGLMSEAFRLGELSISMASLASIASIVAVYIGNNSDIRDFSDEQSGIAYLTMLMVLAFTISPALTDWIAGTTARATLATIILIVGFVGIAETNEVNTY